VTVNRDDSKHEGVNELTKRGRRFPSSRGGEYARFKRTRQLVHTFFSLIFAALLISTPAASQTPEDQIGVRLIVVKTEAEAASLRNQIQSGQSFEEVAKKHSIDSSAKDGGYLGLLRLTDLNANLGRILTELKAGQISPPTAIGGEFLIVQRLTSEEAHWTAPYKAGLAAFESARYEDAVQHLLQALAYAEKLTPVDVRLEDNLHGLAEAYRLQKKYAEAEPFYRRYLGLHWGGPNVPEVLDRFSALVALSYFKHSQFEEALRKFREAVDHSPVGEGLFMAMSAILFEAQLIDEAEALAERASQLFPTSRSVHFQLAELYRRSWKPRKALQAFETFGRVKASDDIDPAVYRLQRSVVYQKVGSIHTELAEFDQAASAYMKALEFTPDSVDARLGLGDVYLQQGKPQDALTEYNRALAMDAKSAPAYFRVADANLRLGRFAEASQAAAKVLALDAAHQKAHYVLATALVRMDAQEASERELEVHRKLEAEARAETDRSRNIVVVNREAAAKLLEARAEDAGEMFMKAIETFPDSATAYLNLGIVQSQLGQHKAAVETFQRVLTRNISDSFLVSWNLAQEYRHLGDTEASLRHQVVYLQNVDLALREALESKLD
jgi:tetratricopeptide (TPR) repeat protein